MFLRIEIEEMAQIELEGLEMLVYTTLCYLCRNAPWQGTMTDLAKKSRCGGRDTARRKVNSLLAKGYVQLTEHGYICAQIAQNSAQIAQENAQIAQISKEKSNKKENIKENNEVTGYCVREKTHPTASPNEELINDLFMMQQLMPEEKAKVPANTGYYKIIVTEFGYMQPKLFVDEFYLHYNAHGWPNGGNKLDLMRYWMSRHIKQRGAKKPSLNETERAVMKTFLDNIEERLIVRLFNVLQQFEVTNEAIIFCVPKENVDKFIEWLKTLPYGDIFGAYNRKIKVRW